MVSTMRVLVMVLGMVMASMVTSQARPKQMTIAAIFDQGQDQKHELAFRHAVQSINRNR